MNDIILSAENVFYKVEPASGGLSKKTAEILSDVNIKLKRGSVLGITGESGSGKSTLAKILTGIHNPTSGKIIYNLRKDWSRAYPKPVQILFQNDGDLINPFRRVKDILNEAFELKLKKQDSYFQMISDTLQTFGLDRDSAEKKGYQLSGGEKQRIALARIVIAEPEILIFDEPFSAQDIESQMNILKIIKKIKGQLNLSLIIISHDINILAKSCDNIIVLSRGRIAESGSTEELLNNPKNDYTKFLLRAQSLRLSGTEIGSFYGDYE